MTEQDIFLAVIELPDAAGRTAYLDKICAGDDSLRARVEGLLRSHETAGSFLHTPAVTAPDAEHAPTRVYAPTPNPSAEPTEGEGSVSEPDDEPLTFLSPPGRADSLGRIGHYEVLQVLGRGGFGIVFRAFDEVLQRVVAVKVLAPQLAATSPARKRFLREARTSARVRHENVVQVHAVEEHPLPYLVMEFIPGETLQQRVNRAGPLEVPEALRIGRQIAEGLAAAHATDLIHRDVKPGNILMEGGQQRVKLTDFGLARAADDASISQSGIIAGTPMFMAPEQAKGESLDQRADLFSLGSVLYTMVAGRPPFRANGTLAVLKRVAEDTPRPIREITPEAPQWLCDIISKLHEKDPDDRFQSAREVADVLADCEAQLKANAKVKPPIGVARSKRLARATPGRRKWGAAAAVLLLPLVAWGIYALTRPGSQPTEKPGGPTEAQSNGDKARIQGRWRMVALEQNGKQVPVGEHVFGYRVEFTGDTSVTYADGKPLPAPFALNPGTDPKELDVLTRGQGTIRHIYRFDGDNLVVALGGPGRPRPTGFTTTPATTFSVATCVRDTGPMPGPVFKNGLGMEFVIVPKGKSWLGGSKDAPGDKEVTVPADFYLGKYEVTQEEWAKVTGENPSHFRRKAGAGDPVKGVSDEDLNRFPVDNISWDQAQLFVQRLNQLEKEPGWVYRLPTDAEWEYACRGGPMADRADSAFDYYFARPTNTLLVSQANFGKETGLNRTCKVGRYEANRLGLFDMHGNVCEWCGDAAEKAEKGIGLRINRGGGWNEGLTECMAGRRALKAPTSRYNHRGLRVARVPAGATPP